MKNKVIICDMSNSHKGKTSTLKLLCMLLEKQKWVKIKNFEIPDSDDLFFVFSKNDIAISIITQGDVDKDRKKYMKEAIKQYKSNIIICASRIHKERIKWEDALYKEYDVINFSNFWTDRPKVEAIESLNQISAKNLANLIEDLLLDKVWKE